jgi:NADH-quinone oxidoreductase subunit E
MDTAPLDALFAERQYQSENLIELLQDIQGLYNFLPEEALWKVSETLQVPVIEVFRVANFYKAFTLKPRGRHLIPSAWGLPAMSGAPPGLSTRCSAC